MNKEKSFAKELAELINRHSIDAKFETADDILATVAIDALNAYAKAKQTQERRNNPDTDTCDCPACQMRRAMEAKNSPVKSFVIGGRIHEKEFERILNTKKEYKKPQAFDVPKEVQAMAEFFGEMFPGTTVEIHRVEMPQRNPRNKRRGKNKHKGGRKNE